MRAMILDKIRPVVLDSQPLMLAELPDPIPAPGQVLIQVLTCGVCHTELDEIEGRTLPPVLPVVPGHQVVGRVIALGEDVREPAVGQRVGVGWIASSCGTCHFCLAGLDNLCADFRATGRDINGGYAEQMVVDARYAFPLPDELDDVRAAPLLCAGAIGWRSLRLCGLEDGQPLGLTGFGASGHLVLALARHRYPHSEVFVFARSKGSRHFAHTRGAAWTGDTMDAPPVPLQAVIDTTPAWAPVLKALEFLRPGGRLVINAIRKEDADREVLLELDYVAHLWREREIKSVANVAGRDIREILELALAADLRPETKVYGLEDANRALIELRSGGVKGAKVLRISD